MSAAPGQCFEHIQRLKQQVSVMRKEIKNLRQNVDSVVRAHKKHMMSLQSILTDGLSQEKQPTTKSLSRDPGGTQLSLEQGHIQTVPIGYISSCFANKNGTPRQPAICSSSRASLQIRSSVFNNPEHALAGLDQYSHVWLIFLFHKNGHMSSKAKVKPPRLNGLKVGLYSTRSPHRPNALGLTLAQLDGVTGDTLHLSSVDLIAGTPVLDIKPYIPEYDSPLTRLNTDARHQQADVSVTLDAGNDYEEEPGEAGCEPSTQVTATEPLESTHASDPSGTQVTRASDFSKVLAEVKDYLQQGELFAESSAERRHTDRAVVAGSEDERDVASSVSYGPEAFGRIAAWIRDPPVGMLSVRFTPTAERELAEFGAPESTDMGRPKFRFLAGPEAAVAAIRALLSADPRSVYRRTRCPNHLFFFSLDTADVTCWFGDGFAEVLRVRPAGTTLDAMLKLESCMALHEAILKGDFVVTRRLVERGADVNAHDANSRTPLMLCCLHCDEGRALGVARMLLAHGGHVGSRDCRGRTALVYAVLYQRPDLVRIFLHALDSDPTAPDHAGGTPLGYAARNGHRTIEKLLLQTVRRYGWSGETGNGVTKLLNRGTGGGAAPVQPIGNQTLRSDHSGQTNTLPYKALSEKVWTNRDTFQREPRPKHLPAARAPGQAVSGETGVKSGDKAEKKGKSGDKSSSLDWRLDMRSLLEILQEQNSASYRVCAQPRPQPPRTRCRSLRPVATSGLQGALYMRRQNSRKLSLSALDDTVLGKKLVRRRCTVAVIPPIRPVGGRTPSFSGLNSLRLQRDSNVMHSTKSYGKATLPKITALKK